MLDDGIDKTIPEEMIAPEKALDDLAIEVFSKYDFNIRLMFPFVLVRVLPREGKTKSGIILPGGDPKSDTSGRNKPSLDGIVLKTWEPFTKEFTHDIRGMYKDVKREMRSDFNVGDHIAFSSWLGQPVRGLPESLYRVIPERFTYDYTDGPVPFKFEYQKEDDFAVFKSVVTRQQYVDGMRDSDVEELWNSLLSRFDIVGKITESKL